ncbi:hypothetical protein [Tepidibacillus marianensis]|uniref:hypothetical protein n=1 Tax=Tepidibacillus marianensis TaxID=3131995 RepID=UPI0030CD489D
MTASAPITIESTELRSKVEESLGKITDELWQRAEKYARRKLNSYRERWPEADYFDNTYLVLLTEDTVKETAFSDYTITVSAMIMEAREAITKGAKQ